MTQIGKAARGLTSVSLVGLLATIPTAGQRQYTPSRTPDGQPDLQGYWTNATYTPLQRPNSVTKELYTR